MKDAFDKFLVDNAAAPPPAPANELEEILLQVKPRRVLTLPPRRSINLWPKLLALAATVMLVLFLRTAPTPTPPVAQVHTTLEALSADLEEDIRDVEADDLQLADDWLELAEAI